MTTPPGVDLFGAEYSTCFARPTCPRRVREETHAAAYLERLLSGNAADYCDSDYCVLMRLLILRKSNAAHASAVLTLWYALVASRQRANETTEVIDDTVYDVRLIGDSCRRLQRPGDRCLPALLPGSPAVPGGTSPVDCQDIQVTERAISPNN